MLDMLKIAKALKDRYMSQKAQGMVEYALIIAFVVALAVVLMSDGGLSGAISGVFGKAASTISTQSAGTTTSGT